MAGSSCRQKGSRTRENVALRDAALGIAGPSARAVPERNVGQPRVQQAAFDDHIKSVATNGGGGAAAEISEAKGLLDSGTINQLEFDALKAKALA